MFLSRVILPALNVLRRTPRSALSISTYPKDSEEEMTITDNGDVVVCWHPEKPFPYECSKPIPPPDPPSNSIYKMETKDQVYRIFKEKNIEFQREELAKLTSTTKHRWYPKNILRRKKTPRNRPFL